MFRSTHTPRQLTRSPWLCCFDSHCYVTPARSPGTQGRYSSLTGCQESLCMDRETRESQPNTGFYLWKWKYIWLGPWNWACHGLIENKLGVKFNSQTFSELPKACHLPSNFVFLQVMKAQRVCGILSLFFFFFYWCFINKTKEYSTQTTTLASAKSMFPGFTTAPAHSHPCATLSNGHAQSWEWCSCNRLWEAYRELPVLVSYEKSSFPHKERSMLPYVN